MAYQIIARGESRSFPKGDAFLEGAGADGEVVLHLGSPLAPDPPQGRDSGGARLRVPGRPHG